MKRGEELGGNIGHVWVLGAELQFAGDLQDSWSLPFRSIAHEVVVDRP